MGCLAGMVVDTLDLRNFRYEIIPHLPHMLHLRLMIGIDHLRRKPHACDPRQVLRTGTHEVLLPASVNNRADQCLVLDIECPTALRSMDLMSAH